MRVISTVILALAVAATPALAKKHHHEDAEPEYDCKEKLSDRGDQRTTEPWAKTAADKAWVQSARFKYGELFSDMKNARGIAYECVTTGPTGLLHRCEITGFPCRAVKQAGN